MNFLFRESFHQLLYHALMVLPESNFVLFFKSWLENGDFSIYSLLKNLLVGILL